MGSISEPLEELKELAAHCYYNKAGIIQLYFLALLLFSDFFSVYCNISVFKKLEYISSHYDDVFTGYINRITGNGIFIYIEKLMMTGYID